MQAPVSQLTAVSVHCYHNVLCTAQYAQQLSWLFGGYSSEESKLCHASFSRLLMFLYHTESGESDSDEGGRGSAARREPVPALDGVGADDKPGKQPYDEVERVLGHR